MHRAAALFIKEDPKRRQYIKLNKYNDKIKMRPKITADYFEKKLFYIKCIIPRKTKIYVIYKAPRKVGRDNPQKPFEIISGIIYLLHIVQKKLNAA